MRLKRNVSPTTLSHRPDPPKPTIHNHPPNQALTIIALFACSIIAIVLGWHFLVYVFSKFGSRHPERDLATVIIVLIVIAVVGFIAKYILASIIRMYLDNRIELKEIELQMAYQQQLTATTGSPSGRALGVEERFAKIILTVMNEAYNHLAQVGQYKHGDAMPWSRRQVLRHVIDGKQVTEREASRIRTFLEGNGIIIRDEIQIGRYERLDDIRAMLDRRYNIPIAYNSPSLPSRQNQGYEFTDENARMG